MAWINRGTTPEYMTSSTRLFRARLGTRSSKCRGGGRDRVVDVMVSITYMTDDQATRLASAEAAFARALALAPEHALAT